MDREMEREEKEGEGDLPLSVAKVTGRWETETTLEKRGRA